MIKLEIYTFTRMFLVVCYLKFGSYVFSDKEKLKNMWDLKIIIKELKTETFF